MNRMGHTKRGKKSISSETGGKKKMDIDPSLSLRPIDTVAVFFLSFSQNLIIHWLRLFVNTQTSIFFFFLFTDRLGKAAVIDSRRLRNLSPSAAIELAAALDDGPLVVDD